MSDNASTGWPDLVAEARRDPRRVEAIIERLNPILRKLARGVAGRLFDDAMQAAHVAIWRALPKVDLDRGYSIRAMLLRTAYYAMRDEVRREMRQARIPLDIAASLQAGQCDRRPQSFGGILDDYAEYVRRTGSFAGAHRHMARRLGVCIAKTTSDFHRAAREYVEREGLCPPRKQYARVVERILQTADADAPIFGG